MAASLTLPGMLVAAIAVRLPNLSLPPFEFHAARQFHSVLIARDLYFKLFAAPPPWMRQVSYETVARQPRFEAPIGETVAAVGYWIGGGEYLWIQRLVHIAWWVLAGYVMYLIAARVMSRRAALAASAFFLFMPFALTMSRSMQPEALMVLTELIAILALLRWDERPTGHRLAMAIVASAVAIFVKTPAAFYVFGPFFLLSLRSRGLRRALWSRETTLFTVLTLIPGVAWTLGGNLDATDRLSGTWFTSTFVTGWLVQVNVVAGLPAAVVACLAALFFARGRARALFAGMLTAYVTYGLFFDYGISTHSYYSVHLLFVVALGLGVVVDMAPGSRPRRWLTAAATASVAGSLLSAALHYVPANVPASDARISYYREIGRAIGHSDKVVLLESGFSSSGPMNYYGLIVATDWPGQADLQHDLLLRRAAVPAAYRLAQMGDRRWFVITDLSELQAQPDLQALLAQHAQLGHQGHGYRIYDLKAGLPVGPAQ